MKKLLLFTTVLIYFVSPSFSQSEIKAVRIENPPEIDGMVVEDVWEKAFLVDEFYQREPNEGAPASKRTEFLVCYDKNNMYFGIKCWDDPEKVTAKEMARDVSLGNDDRIQIILDTYMDKRNAYWFQIGPRGSIGDAIISENGAEFNKQWDGLFNGKARITDYGWEAELAIPFKTIGFDKNSDKWGIKFIRYIVDNLELSYWPSADLDARRFQVSDAGVITGIENITQGIGLDISPYLVTGIDTKKGEKNDPTLTGGVDMFYQITPSLKSSLTINTDFAETEVDDRQINLTRFNLHFPEKRDFFLDGANYFQFGINSKRIIPFFSRRMGLNEHGIPIPINVGAKLTGQMNNWNLGFMHINDNSETGFNNYTVARVSRNLWKQSSVGIIGTRGNAVGDMQNLLAGADFKLSTPSFRGNKNVSLILFGLKSKTETIDEDDTAWGAQFNYPNDLINAGLGYHQIGRNFTAGMGFVPRVNIRQTYGDLSIGPRPDRFGILQLQFGGGFNHITNLETGKLATREFEINPMGIRFMSGEEVSYTITSQYEMLLTNFNIFEDFVIPKGEYEWWKHRFQLQTKGARNIWGTASYGIGNFFNGNRQDLTLRANWKVIVPLFVGGTFIQNHVILPDGDFTANIYQFNANVLFSPDITLYNFVQYDNDSKSTGWQSRFQWIVKPGNEIILAWTANFLQAGEQYLLDAGTTRLKLKYNIRF